MDPITLLMMTAGLGKSIWGGIQLARGAAMAKRNQRPVYDIPDEYYINVGTYEQMAQEGLPASDLDRIHQESMRGLSASLSTGLQLGASANTTNDYYRSYLDNLGEIGIKNSMARFQNINALAGSREALANQEFVQFGYNKDAPYKDRAQLAATEKSEGIQNVAGGIDMGISAIAGQESRDLYKEQINRNNGAMSNETNSAGPTGGRTTFINQRVRWGAELPGEFDEFAKGFRAESAARAASRELARTGLPSSPNENNYYWRKLADSWWLQPGQEIKH